MAALATIREAIRAALDVNLDLSPYTGVQISAYPLASPSGPYVQVFGPEEIKYHGAMVDGHSNWLLRIQAGVPLQDARGSTELLDRMCESSGSASIKAAIEQDKTLGGAVQNCIVTGVSGYGQYATAQGDTLGCEFSVAVIA